jgi:serine/threonine-protein phosphatase PP1 catalytic subunit
LHDLLFACPVTTNGGGWSGKNTLALEFGADVLSSFLEKNDFDLVLRGHRQVQEGYEFFANRMLVTLFSARNFDGSTNDGAIIETDENLTCTFRNSKSQRN